MNCHYCNQTCFIYGDGWKCTPCQTEYQRGVIRISCHIKGQEYTLEMRYEHSDFPARIWKRKDSYSFAQPILALKEIPQGIIPSNIRDKLKFYLTFS